MLPDEDASRARVVEMDVREEKMAEVGGLDTTLLQPLLQAIEARGGTAIEQGRPVLRLEQVRAHDALGALMVQVDGIRAH